jgi:hypothetical protein
MRKRNFGDGGEIMPRILHKNAGLTVHRRRMIRESKKPIRVWAKEPGVSPVIV